MRLGGTTAPVGSLNLYVIRKPKPGKSGFLTHAMPRRGQPREVNAWRLKNLPRLTWQAVKIATAVKVAGLCGVTTAYGRLSLKVTRGDGRVLDYGIASYRVVTTAGVGFIVDAHQNSVELENMKYHGFGTGTGAEASSDTALGTEFTTEYATNSTRPTGSLTEGASANIFETAATFTPDSGGTLAVTEHGIFSASSAGVLLDRSKFAAVNIDSASGDSIVATYDLTYTAGS